MNIVLDGKAFEAALVEMSVAYFMVMLLPASRVGHGEAGHECRELPGSRRAEEQMPVIRHDAVGEEADGNGCKGVSHDAFEGGEVLVFLEDFAAADAAVEDMKDHSGGGDARGAGHDGECNGGGVGGQIIAPVPFFFPPFFFPGQDYPCPRTGW